MTHRGPLQPRPFCDSVNSPSTTEILQRRADPKQTWAKYGFVISFWEMC